MTSRGCPSARPDSATGDPRPLRAPVEPSWVEYGPPGAPPGPRKLPPPEEGPLLEWHRHDRKMRFGAAAFGFFVPASLLVYNLIVTGEGLRFLTQPRISVAWYFLILLPFLSAAIFYRHFNREFVAAGAGWVAHNSGWVRTYDLIQVKVEIDAQPFLYLLDSDLRAIRPPLREIQQNRDLWDLVYNGILHSFQERHVHTDPNARRLLQLHGPAMRNELRLAREGPRPDEFVIIDRPRWWRRAPRRYRRGERR